MKLRKIYIDLRGDIRIVVCVIAAVLIFLIAIPSFAEDGYGEEEAPGTETTVITEEVTEETTEEIAEEITEGSNAETAGETTEETNAETVGETTEEAGGDDTESAAEVIEEGYVTMKAVSGDPSVTD